MWGGWVLRTKARTDAGAGLRFALGSPVTLPAGAGSTRQALGAAGPDKFSL